MPLGATEPFNLNVKTGNKKTTAQIALGKVAIRDASVTPNVWKQCDAANANGPFGVAVNDLADLTDPHFAIAYPPSEVIMKAGAGLQPNQLVKTDANGDVVPHNTGTDAEILIVGRYITKEGENDQVAAITNDGVKIRLGAG